jgi:hypothetical protein
MKRTIAIISLFLFQNLAAQDSHEWNLFSGNEASLLGAASIAGVDDFSTAFYNPGYLAYVNKNFSLNGNLFSAQEIKAENAAGENNNIYTSLFNIIPNMTAGPLPFQLDKKGSFGYIIFEKQYAANTYSYLKQEYADLIHEFDFGENSPTFFEGNEFYSGEFTYEKSLTEYWAGISWGRSSKHWGVGFSLFGALRSQKNSFDLYSLAADMQNDIAVTTNFKYNLDYFNVRLILKTGIVYNDDDFRFGLTFTTPSVHIYGNGNIGGNISSTGIFYRDENNNVYGPFDFIATNREQNLPTYYRSPSSAAFGLVKKFGTTEIGIGGEYFASLPLDVVISPEDARFVIINPSDEDIEANGKLIILTTHQVSREIFNFGFSIKQYLSKKFTAYFNFHTDFSTQKKNDDKFIYVNNEIWDIYHFTTGVIYRTKKTLIGTSVQYSFSRDKNLTSFTNLNSSPLENNEMFLINNEPTSMDIIYNRILISVGITYFIEPLF